MLRLKANYLWPAMWNNAFNEDDPENPRLADEYGIVMGTRITSRCCARRQEWKRHGKGPWNYSTNAAGTARVLGRGHRSATRTTRASSRSACAATATCPCREDSANIALLEQIVADQREDPREEHESRPREKCRRVWALYKEVQDYYDKGMRVPDDVTLLWCDDNWGEHSPPAHRGGTQAQRRRGDLLPLRLRRRSAQLQVAQHQSDLRKSGSR